MNRLTMTDMGNISLVLGMQLTRDREAGTLMISQEYYTKSILAGFGIAGCNPVHTTGGWRGTFNRSAGRPPARSHRNGAVQSITGSLMFLSQCTRYDITYSVNQWLEP